MKPSNGEAKKTQLADDTAIAVRNVSKCYRVFENQRARLRHALLPSYTQGANEVWALRDINFEVNRGESVAIIGRNGSGKSTLLEIITGTLTPTTGGVQVNGRVAALLELGSGFNPEYTGRENVFLNGLLLGLSRSEMKQHFDDIASFADIGDVLDRPVKTYSSGMLVRLAFAVQVALEPEILVVDEALSVGDYFFQQKCFSRLRQMRENGLTLLFVSHDMGTVRDVCNRAVYLRRGDLAYLGDSKAAIRKYFAEQMENHQAIALTHVAAPTSFSPNSGHALLEEITKQAIWKRLPSEEPMDNRGARLFAVQILDSNETPITQVRMGDTILMRVYFSVMIENGVHVSCTMKNKYDQVVNVSSTHLLGMPPCLPAGKAFAVLELRYNCTLEAGLYSLQIRLSTRPTANQSHCLDETGWFGPLEIRWNYTEESPPFMGMFGLPVEGQYL